MSRKFTVLSRNTIIINRVFFIAGVSTNNNPSSVYFGGPDILKTIPMGRIAVPDDVVGPILFLAGDASRFMTGQVLYVNGGRLTP